MKRIIISFFILALFAEPILSNDKDSLNQQILKAINDGANYGIDVLLDEDGKSKCDYNMIEGKWYIYEAPWHTGQLIWGLVEAYKITKNEKYLAGAKRAGDWWTSLQIKDGSKLDGMLKAIHGDYIEDYIVFATISDGTPGLFELYRLTGEKKYADVPTSAGNWMLENMYLPEHGIFYDVVDVHTGEVYKDKSPFWPDKENHDLYDVARPNNEGFLFKDMYEYSKDEKYKKVFIELCESLVEKQGPEGLWMDFMPNFKEEGSFHPRFNLWYAESLIEGYELTGDKRYLEAAKKTAQMFAKTQKGDGTIYYKNTIDGKSNQNSLTGSAVSFAGIIWLRLLQHGEGEEFKKNIELSLDWVLKNRFANDHPDKNLAGAFLETRTRRVNDKIWLTMRDIATSFGLRFLSDYYNHINRNVN